MKKPFKYGTLVETKYPLFLARMDGSEDVTKLIKVGTFLFVSTIKFVGKPNPYEKWWDITLIHLVTKYHRVMTGDEIRHYLKVVERPTLAEDLQDRVKFVDEEE